MIDKDVAHIAFVDDEPALHTLVKLKFKKEIRSGSIITYHFTDGQECIDFLRSSKNQNNIIFLFSDISMPNMDGFELVKCLKDEFPEIKTYMASALGMKEYQDKAYELGIVDFFVKPLDFELIKETINEIKKAA